LADDVKSRSPAKRNRGSRIAEPWRPYRSLADAYLFATALDCHAIADVIVSRLCPSSAD
jgi:hypothetical protein